MSTNHFAQLLRYGIVGLGTNALGYVLYLGLTAVGMGPKLAMSLLYAIGVLQTFVFNKSWTFRYAGRGRSAFWRHVILYVAGYGLNFALLSMLVDTLNWPHQGVMAGLVVLMAVFFFLGQKFWVFRQSSIVNAGG
jgi:putative flippase GtrA